MINFECVSYSSGIFCFMEAVFLFEDLINSISYILGDKSTQNQLF